MELLRPCSDCHEREIVYVKRKLCRRCNDKWRGKIRWDTVKKDPIKHREWMDRMARNSRKRRGDNPEQRDKDRAQCRKWYANNKEYRKEYYKQYFIEKHDYHLIRVREHSFDGLYIKVIERDKYTCVRCGKSLKLGRYLNVHHLDRNKKNNTMENLITVCTKCHQGYFHRDKYEKLTVKP